MTSAPLPPEFADLRPFVTRWAVASIAARHECRLGCSEAERRHFYETCAPRLESMVDYLNRFDLQTLPESATVLLRLALSLCQVALAIENNGSAEAEHALSARMLKLSKELDHF